MFYNKKSKHRLFVTILDINYHNSIWEWLSSMSSNKCAHTSHEKRRHRQSQRRPWSTPASACGQPRVLVLSGSACTQHNSSLSSCNMLIVMHIQQTHTHISYSPGCIRCSYKEIYHHPVAHVESLLHLPVVARHKKMFFLNTHSIKINLTSLCILLILTSQFQSLGSLVF